MFYPVGPLKTIHRIINPPTIRHMYAITDTIPAMIPRSLCLLSKIKPIDKIRSIIPANDIYIFSIDGDIIFTPTTNTFTLHMVLYHMGIISSIKMFFDGIFSYLPSKVNVFFNIRILSVVWDSTSIECERTTYCSRYLLKSPSGIAEGGYSMLISSFIENNRYISGGNTRRLLGEIKRYKKTGARGAILIPV